MEMKEILIKAEDGSLQPSLFYPASKPGRPLLVGLHTWSFDRFNQIGNMLPLAKKLDYNLILPEFRGANLTSNPQRCDACASPLAVSDVIGAVDYAIDQLSCDGEKVFLLGLSGGGHMALMMAAKHPKRFCAIGAFVPITDLNAWAEENQNYRPHVLACCSESRDEMAARSPISYVPEIASANLKIFHGKYDGVVPVSHSLRLYSKIMEYDPKSRVFLDIFDGGHQIDMAAAEYWITSQDKKITLDQVTG